MPGTRILLLDTTPALLQQEIQIHSLGLLPDEIIQHPSIRLSVCQQDSITWGVQKIHLLVQTQERIIPPGLKILLSAPMQDSSIPVDKRTRLLAINQGSTTQRVLTILFLEKQQVC